MHKIWLNLVLISFLHSLMACGQQTFDQKLQLLYKNTVPLLKPNEVKERLQKGNVVLLDARSPEEYSVSHLPNAQFVGYDDFDMEEVEGIPKDKEIIIYCAVGYRSEKIGEKLKEAGFDNVSNMYGGIFQWKNEGLDVVNEKGEVTDSVHAYNKLWGMWIDKDKAIKVYE